MNTLRAFRLMVAVIVASLFAVPALGVRAASECVVHNTAHIDN